MILSDLKVAKLYVLAFITPRTWNYLEENDAGPRMGKNGQAQGGEIIDDPASGDPENDDEEEDEG